MICIQEFYEYKNFDIKGYLIDHVNMFCHERKNTITKIRLILRAFRFVYRVIYRELLEDIIISAKTNLLALLQALPEILPYTKHASSDEEISLYEGIWREISKSEWESNLHLEKVNPKFIKGKNAVQLPETRRGGQERMVQTLLADNTRLDQFKQIKDFIKPPAKCFRLNLLLFYQLHILEN
jgi:hypothetical protein